MNCGEIDELIHGHLDGELDLTRSLEIERHIAACPSCSRTRADYQSMHQAIAGGSLYFESPLDLRRNLHSALRRAHRAEAGGSRLFWRWRFVLPSLAAVALTVVLVLVLGVPPNTETLAAQDAVSAHVRSLMPGHLVDIPSSDQHTVKPWFNGKVDFSPTVKDLGVQGFVLIGGRLDFVGGRTVAAIVYQRRKHLINLFIWPATGSRDSAERSFERHGYNLVRWISSGMEYWAVSDINAEDLRQFAALLHRADTVKN